MSAEGEGDPAACYTGAGAIHGTGERYSSGVDQSQ